MPSSSLAHRVWEVAIAVSRNKVAIFDLNVVLLSRVATGGIAIREQEVCTPTMALAFFSDDLELGFRPKATPLIQPRQTAGLQHGLHEHVWSHSVCTADDGCASECIFPLDGLPRPPQLPRVASGRQQPNSCPDVYKRLHPSRIDAVGIDGHAIIIKDHRSNESIAPILQHAPVQ